ncbi:MAG: rod shape-determining protein MreC [Candidatus Marinimicrobia bacterium]|nr:rod shape-determining protein MreC [Candidatus Neomarinimicrobiota bacterium]
MAGRSLYLSILRNKPHIAFVIFFSLSLNILLTGDSSASLDLIRGKTLDIFSFLYSPLTWIKSSFLLEEENTLLREKNLRLSLQVESMLQLVSENKRLEQLLEFKRESKLTLLASKVINKGLHSNITSISIDVGSLSGVGVNNPVLTTSGVVGKTILVADRSSVVQLLSDLNFRLSVRILPSEATGILRWVGRNLCEIREVQKNAEIEMGNKVVTSGFSKIYPRNLPVGEVIGITVERGSFQKIISIRVNDDLGSLINVFVITDQSDELD